MFFLLSTVTFSVGQASPPLRSLSFLRPVLSQGWLRVLASGRRASMCQEFISPAKQKRLSSDLQMSSSWVCCERPADRMEWTRACRRNAACIVAWSERWPGVSERQAGRLSLPLKGAAHGGPAGSSLTTIAGSTLQP